MLCTRMLTVMLKLYAIDQSHLECLCLPILASTNNPNICSMSSLPGSRYFCETKLPFDSPALPCWTEAFVQRHCICLQLLLVITAYCFLHGLLHSQQVVFESRLEVKLDFRRAILRHWHTVTRNYNSFNSL